MTETCPECGSTEIKEVDAEISFTCEQASRVCTSGKAMLCSLCGFVEYLIPEAALAQLRQGSSSNGNGHLPR